MGDFGGNSAILDIKRSKETSLFEYSVHHCLFVSTNVLVLFLVVSGTWIGLSLALVSLFYALSLFAPRLRAKLD